MPGISRNTIDTAGGALIASGQSTVYAEGYLIVVEGDHVTSHGSAPHGSATMPSGSSTVFINGKAVCRSGDVASCGHSATGSSTVFSG